MFINTITGTGIASSVWSNAIRSLTVDPAVLPTTMQGSGVVTLTSTAVANSYGSYVQLIASTSAQVIWIIAHAFAPSGTPGGLSYVQIKLATGAGGSEVDIPGFPHLLLQLDNVTVTRGECHIAFRLKVPIGTRISAAAAPGNAVVMNCYCSICVLE